MLQFYIYRYLTSALIGDEGFQRPKISVAKESTPSKSIKHQRDKQIKFAYLADI